MSFLRKYTDYLAMFLPFSLLQEKKTEKKS